MSLPSQDALLCDPKVTEDSVLGPAACRGQAVEAACRPEPARLAVRAPCGLFAQGQPQEGNRLQTFAIGPLKFSSEQNRIGQGTREV